MAKSLKTKSLLMLIVFCLVFSSFSSVMAAGQEERVLQMAPAKDAAVVDGLEGFKTYSYQGKLGKYNIPEGLVIRQSYIKDGKIYIPPSGLYYTIRLSNYHTNPFGENALFLLGQKYYWVDFGFHQDILADVTFEKVGDRVAFGDGSKSLELTGFSMTGPGFIAPTATFSILKPSGNYYGSTFAVTTDPKFLDITSGVLNGGTGKTSGSYGFNEDEKSWIEEYYGTSVARTGASYLVADEVTTDKAVIKEFGTGAFNFGLFTDKEPEKMVLGVDERAIIGDWHVKVEGITANSAKVKLWNSKTNEVLQKELGPLTAETTSRMPADQNQRSLFTIRPDSNEIHVQLDIYNNPFEEEGKVKLVGFYDIFKVSNPDKWPTDDRFIFRPDT